MLTRKIPVTGEAIPVIGLGTWNVFNPKDVNEQTLAPLAEVLRLFYDSGGRMVDTAPSYGTPRRSRVLLTTDLGLTDKLFFATKVLEHDEAAGVKSFERSSDCTATRST